MNGALSLLVQIGFLAGLVAVFLLPMYAAEHWFGLRRPWPFLVGAGSVAVTFFVLFRCLLRSQLKEQTVLSTSQHAVFGEVRRLKDHWEASVEMTRDLPAIEVWGDSAAPSDVQAATFAAVRERYPELLARALDGAREFFAPSDFTLSPGDLHLESIYLAADALGSFDLIFSFPAHERHIPWGMTVQFVDFNIDEISDNH